MNTSRLDDPARLGIIEASGLMDRPPTETLERFTRIAGLALDVPVTLVTLVGADRQVNVAGPALPEPWSLSRQVPLSHSVCRLVVESDAPLVVSDARQDERLAAHPAVVQLGVGAYAGMPLASDAGALGAFCAVSAQPRTWTENELTLLAELASAAADFIRIRSLSRDAVTQKREQATSVRAVAHDVRSPLHVVRLSLSALKDPAVRKGNIDELLETALDQIDVASTMLERLGAVQDALDEGAPRERMDLGHVLHAEIEAIRQQAPDVEWVLDAGGEAWVVADVLAVRRVLGNLLSNASRFATTVARVVSAVADEWVEIHVEDDGPGLPTVSDYRHVWDAGAMFHRGRGSHTGVGLAVVRAIVEQHGGSVDAGDSELGGARFVIRLPSA